MLLDAAATEIERDPRASLQRIAIAAGLGRTTLHRHFPTRTDLVRALEQRARLELAEGEPVEAARSPLRAQAEGVLISAPSAASELTRAELGQMRPPGQLGREQPLAVDATHVLNEVPPHLVADQLVAEARRVAAVPVALYVADIDGSRLVRLAGSDEFPLEIGGALAVGPEIAPDAIPDLWVTLESELPGCVPAPLWVRGRAIGVLIAVGPPRVSLADIARQGTLALELATAYTDVFEMARRRRPTSPAAEIQLNLLPPRHARMAGAEVSGSLLPSYDVGGDWFDYVENRDGAWLAIADASGKGATSAALASIALGALRAARRSGFELEQAAISMDRVVSEVGDASFSLSAIVARWHAPTSTFDWINCGHRLPLLVAVDGTLQSLHGRSCPPFGRARAGQEYRRESRRLARGERIVLYTDGISERRTADGGFFGLEGIERVLAELAGAPAAAIVRALQDAVVQASPEPLDDDAAIIVLAVA